MSLYEIVKSKIDRLIRIRLNEGVQPEDLANNIFLSDYKSISFKKNADMIIGELTFSEQFEGRLVDTTLRYIYDINKVLMRIEEHTDMGMTIEWDRDSIEHELINDVVSILKNNYTTYQIKEFLSSLPEDLKNKIEIACSKAA